MQLFTIQMSAWREAKSRDIKMLDITVKSGIQAFAPSWENLRAYKQGRMDDVEYEEYYREKMKRSRERHDAVWRRFKDHSQLALACYCGVGQFCHRHIFAQLVSEYLQEQGLHAIVCGEITKAGILPPEAPLYPSAFLERNKRP